MKAWGRFLSLVLVGMILVGMFPVGTTRAEGNGGTNVSSRIESDGSTTITETRDNGDGTQDVQVTRQVIYDESDMKDLDEIAGADVNDMMSQMTLEAESVDDTPYENGEWLYQLDEHGWAIIVGNTNLQAEALKIPATIQGNPVAGIGAEAFSENTELRRLTIPLGVSGIADDAFQGIENQLTLQAYHGAPVFTWATVHGINTRNLSPQYFTDAVVDFSQARSSAVEISGTQVTVTGPESRAVHSGSIIFLAMGQAFYRVDEITQDAEEGKITARVSSATVEECLTRLKGEYKDLVYDASRSMAGAGVEMTTNMDRVGADFTLDLVSWNFSVNIKWPMDEQSSASDKLWKLTHLPGDGRFSSSIAIGANVNVKLSVAGGVDVSFIHKEIYKAKFTVTTSYSFTVNLSGEIDFDIFLGKVVLVSYVLGDIDMDIYLHMEVSGSLSLSYSASQVIGTQYNTKKCKFEQINDVIKKDSSLKASISGKIGIKLEPSVNLCGSSIIKLTAFAGPKINVSRALFKLTRTTEKGKEETVDVSGLMQEDAPCLDFNLSFEISVKGTIRFGSFFSFDLINLPLTVELKKSHLEWHGGSLHYMDSCTFMNGAYAIVTLVFDNASNSAGDFYFTTQKHKVIDTATLAEAVASHRRDGFELEGWYLDEKFEEKYQLNTPVYQDMTLYARWLKDAQDLRIHDAQLGNRVVRVPAGQPIVNYIDEDFNVVQYRFKGLYLDAAYTERILPDTLMPSSAADMYVKYEYDPTYNPFEGQKSLALLTFMHNDGIGYTVIHCKKGAVGVTIPDDYKGEPVTAIGDGCFENCDKLVLVNVGKNVTSIGRSAFNNCTSLKTTNIPDGVTKILHYAYEGCTSLQELTISSTVTSLGTEAFAKSGLTSVLIPNSVTEPPTGLFSGCEKLKTVHIPDGWTKIPSRLFQGCTALTNVNVPSGLTTIETKAFENCQSLGNLTLPKTLTSIREESFSGCSSMTAILVPDAVTYVGDGAFMNCESLKTVVLPKTLTSIPANCFSGDKVLEMEKLPDALTTIGSQAFKDCLAITKLPIPETVTKMGSGVFWTSGLTEISFPQGITEVPEYTCMGCIHLTKVTLHGKMTSIGKDAFYFCKSLKEVQMPSSMRVIGQEAFRDCEELETLRLNEGLTQLKTDFIRNTPKLTTLYIPSTATKIEKRTFADTYIHIITLPEGITHLPDWLFENAHMTNVNLPTTLTSLGTQVFMHCEQLTKVFLPYGVTAIGQWEFGYTYELREIWMPPTVTSIGGYAFYLSLFGAKNQVTVYGEIGSLAQVYVESNAKSEWIFQEYQYQVPDGATSKAVSLDGFEYVIVDEEAYIVGYTGSVSGRLVIPQTLGGAPVVAIAPYSLPGEYQYLTIPETVTEIDPTAFNAAPNLVDFNFSASNPVYTSGDCSLYKSNGDGKTLVRRAPAAPGTTKTVTGVTEIGDYAFAGNSKLNTISLANTVTKVGGMAFADCSSLYSLTFNRVPEDMDEQALVGYTGTVYSRVDDGTLEEFCKTRAIDFNMYYLIYCLEGDAFFTRRVKAGSLVPNDMDMTDEYRSLDGWYADSNRRKLWNFESDLMPYSNTTIFGYWTSDFTYKTANGEVKITGYQGQKKDLELPSMLGGQPVTGIAAKAFVSNEDVTWGMITIPASVTDIEEGAIVGATGITGDRGYAAEKYANENGIPFTVAKHVLSFDTGNGAPITARQLEANAPLSLPTPIWDNHTFCGWYTSSEYEQEWTETRMPAEDLTLTALWLKVDGVLQLEAFQLTYDENGATIVGYTGTQPEVTVPEKLNGYRVVRIADYAFKGNRSMITLTLPDSVEEIGEYAFSDSALAEITFGSGLKSIGAYAFSKCENLTAVILPSGVKEVKAGLFVGCRNLGTLSMGDQVTQIGESALSGLVSLRTLTLSPNLVSLGDHALAGNVNLTSVTLPAKVKTLGEDVFAGCTSLREILVEKGNSNYQSVEGKLLLSANGKTLIAYALGNTETECAVPAGVTVISDYVFREAQNVTSVSIPASVSRIGTGAFQSAEKLARVTFDGKITAIPAGCFSGCTALTAVVLPEGLMTIGEYAFHQAGLASIIIPASVVAIDETAFYECGQFLLIGEKGSEAESFAARMSYAFKAKGEALPVTQILLPQGIMIYEDSSRKVAADVLPKNAANRALTWAVADPSVALVSAEGVITPVAPGNTVLTVTAGDGSGVTASCVVAVIGNISWSMVPKALTTIEEEAFRNNRNLTAVDLTVSKCTSIGEYAFAGCSELQIIRIPATVKTIAQTAFAGIEDSVIIQAPAGSTAASYAYAHGISCLAQ